MRKEESMRNHAKLYIIKRTIVLFQEQDATVASSKA